MIGNAGSGESERLRGAGNITIHGSLRRGNMCFRRRGEENMNVKTFENLEEWGAALDRLEEWKKKRRLNEHQGEIVRLLRYRGNWQLREKAIEYARDIDQPVNELLMSLKGILTADDIYLEARVMAAAALGHLIPKRGPAGKEAEELGKWKMLSALTDLLAPESPPLLRAAAAEALSEMGDKKALPALRKAAKTSESAYLKKCLEEAITTIERGASSRR